MIKKEDKSFFIFIWIVWCVVAFFTFGVGFVPQDIKVYTESGFSGVGVPGPVQILLLLFLVGWPIYGWLVLDRRGY